MMTEQSGHDKTMQYTKPQSRKLKFVPELIRIEEVSEEKEEEEEDEEEECEEDDEDDSTNDKNGVYTEVMEKDQQQNVHADGDTDCFAIASEVNGGNCEVCTVVANGDKEVIPAPSAGRRRPPRWSCGGFDDVGDGAGVGGDGGGCGVRCDCGGGSGSGDCDGGGIGDFGGGRPTRRLGRNNILQQLPSLPHYGNNRLISLQKPHQRGKLVMIMVSVYATLLPRTKTEAVSGISWKDLHAFLVAVPKADKLVVLDDINVRVGTDHVAWRGVLGTDDLNGSSDSGLFLLRTCMEHCLTRSNTYFRLKMRVKSMRMCGWWRH
nr:unnamed protein product [Spirometra erinaceieuropaei]